MDQLDRKVLGGIVRMQVVLAAIIFGVAWSLTYWQGWLFWLVFGASVVAVTLYFLRHDRALIRRRMRSGPMAEQRPQQKLIQAAIAVSLFFVLIVSVLDHRFGWSQPPSFAALGGDVLVALGFFVVFVTFRENSFASSIIEVGEGQRVIDTGPYAKVRHPMYGGAMLMFAGAPPALDSWWGLLPAGVLAGLIVWRLVDEERYLEEQLPGYTEYRHNVRYRLIPLVW